MQQLNIDFNGKKDIKVTISVDDELHRTLLFISKTLETPLSTLAGMYVAECAGRDHGKILHLKQRGKLSVNMDAL